MYFTRIYFQVKPIKNFGIADTGVQVFDFQHDFLSDRAFEAYVEQCLCFNRKLHRQFFEYFLTEERVCAAFLANQQRVTLRVISGAGCLRHDLHQSAVRILRATGRNTF